MAVNKQAALMAEFREEELRANNFGFAPREDPYGLPFVPAFESLFR
jgi:hypothetical protein